MNKSKETIKVCIRIRPLLLHEDSEFWTVNENTISTINNYNTREKDKEIKKLLMDSIYSPQNFAFDKIYENTINTQVIYKEMCRQIIKSAIDGINGTIFMYGQTTSGKTFTMLGTPNSPGILPCTLRDIFNHIQKNNDPEGFTVYCSYLEIYNENMHDLLTDSNNLKLVDDNKYGIIVNGAKRVKIKSFEDGIALKDYGEENRKYRETLINEYSSRSHTIFQIFIENNEIDQQNNSIESMKYSCLSLVDLAGSERLNDYDTKTEAFGETGYINKSLFVLANVINKLAEGKSNYIPYRDSKLTRLLSNALGGNCLTAVVCTISPAAVNYYQTLSTLRFATRAKYVKIKPSVNEYRSEKSSIEFYKNQIKKLEDELKGKRPNEENTSGISVKSDKQILEYIMKTNESLNNELSNYKEMYESEKEKNKCFFDEISKLKQMINEKDSINLSNNNFSNNLNNLGSFSPNYNSNEFNVMSLSNYNSNNGNDIKEMKQPYWDIKSSNKNFNTDIISRNPINDIISFRSDDFISGEDLFINNMINKINCVVENDPKIRNLSSWNEHRQKLYYKYKIDLQQLQNKYKDMIKDTCTKIFPKFSDISGLFSNEDIQENDKDDIIKKITQKSIFKDINLFFQINQYEAFENNIKNLKQTYEDKIDTLEKNMDYYKTYIENYYRKKIQNTRTARLDNIDFLNMEESPIMSITSEHNEKLKTLRELYDTKLKELEHIFFDNLKILTSNKNK